MSSETLTVSGKPRQDLGILKVAFTTYSVENIERARSFYEDTLGLAVSSVAGSGNWVEYDLPGGGCFAITTYMKEIKPSSVAGGSIAFEVEDLAGLLETLKGRGVTIKMDLIQTPVCQMAFILDSEGNGILLHQLHKK